MNMEYVPPGMSGKIRPMICHVYVIGVEGHDLVKVGMTQNVRKRLISLQIASPFKLFLICSFGFPSRGHAMFAEKIFHGFYAEHQSSGEWFSLRYIEAVEGMCRNIITILKHEVYDRDFSECLEATGVVRAIEELCGGLLQ